LRPQQLFLLSYRVKPWHKAIFSLGTKIYFPQSSAFISEILHLHRLTTKGESCVCILSLFLFIIICRVEEIYIFNIIWFFIEEHTITGAFQKHPNIRNICVCVYFETFLIVHHPLTNVAHSHRKGNAEICTRRHKFVTTHIFYDVLIL